MFNQRNINHVRVVFMEGDNQTWPDLVTAASEVFSIDRHGLASNIVKLQYEAAVKAGLLGDEDPRPVALDLLKDAVAAVTGAEVPVVEEWLEMLTEAVQRAAEPDEDEPAVAPV